jgi:hypothetical protein
MTHQKVRPTFEQQEYWCCGIARAQSRSAVDIGEYLLGSIPASEYYCQEPVQIAVATGHLLQDGRANSLRRLWAVQIMAHSARTFSRWCGLLGFP